MPTLDFVAGYTVGESQSLSELNQRNHYSSTGLDTNIPLYRVAGVSVLSRHASTNTPKARTNSTPPVRKSSPAPSASIAACKSVLWKGRGLQ